MDPVPIDITSVTFYRDEDDDSDSLSLTTTRSSTFPSPSMMSLWSTCTTALIAYFLVDVSVGVQLAMLYIFASRPVLAHDVLFREAQSQCCMLRQN